MSEPSNFHFSRQLFQIEAKLTETTRKLCKFNYLSTFLLKNKAFFFHKICPFFVIIIIFIKISSSAVYKTRQNYFYFNFFINVF